jgi:Ca2+-binding EF-hand superfamily protein
MAKMLVERRFRPSTEETLLKAFEVLDQERKDHLTREELAKFLTEEGEPFSSEEIEELMAAALDSQKGTVNYREYVQQLVEEQA